MKIDLGFQSDWKKQLGSWCLALGIGVFFFTFWLPHGFFLGGDPTYFGKYLPELEVLFPLSGIGIFLAFFGRYFLKKQKDLSKPQILFLLLFLGILALSSLFSLSPETSILFLIIWATGFLGLGLGETFLVEGLMKRTLFFLSILLGYGMWEFFPEMGISSQMLGIASVLGIVFSMREKVFSGRMWLVLFYLWVIFQSAHLGLTLLVFFLFAMRRFWLPRVRYNGSAKELTLPFVFLLALMIWGVWQSHFQFSFSFGVLQSLFSGIWPFFFGIGESQYFVALQHFSETLLLPPDFLLPSSSFFFVLIEKGLVGFLLLLYLLTTPLRWSGGKRAFVSLLFLLFLLLTHDLLATENGILFLMIFLFAEEPKESRQLS